MLLAFLSKSGKLSASAQVLYPDFNRISLMLFLLASLLSATIILGPGTIFITCLQNKRVTKLQEISAIGHPHPNSILFLQLNFTDKKRKNNIFSKEILYTLQSLLKKLALIHAFIGNNSPDSPAGVIQITLVTGY
jgi:hypothetical protein